MFVALHRHQTWAVRVEWLLLRLVIWCVRMPVYAYPPDYRVCITPYVMRLFLRALRWCHRLHTKEQHSPSKRMWEMCTCFVFSFLKESCVGLKKWGMPESSGHFHVAISSSIHRWTGISLFTKHYKRGCVSLSLSPRVFSSSPATSYYMESLSSISSRIKCLLLKVVDREQGERETRLFFRIFLDDLHLQNTRQSNVPEYLQSTAR